MIDRKLSCDVLVIGSGGAGLRAAAEAAKLGVSVILVSKGKVNRSGATLLAGANVSADLMADGGSLAAMGFGSADKNDNAEKWYEDIIHEGFYVNDRELVRLYVDTAPQRLQELLDAGAKVTAVEEGGRQIGMAGSEILDALYRMVTSMGVRMLEDTALVELLKDGKGAAAGALLLDVVHGGLISVNSKAVVLATGGMHNCYTFNSGTSGLCGEGHAAAMRMGAEMTLMEMVTFCPDVITAPSRFRGSILPYILQCMGYGRLVNGKGEEFLHKYLSPSAVKLALGSEWNKLLLSYAMHKETEAGLGDEHGGVRFSIAYLSHEQRAGLEEIVPQLKRGVYREIMAGHDAEGGISVHAAGHYFDGGILVDASMASTVPGLYAAGECAGGLFGANRVGAATTQMLVMGAKAGESAATYALESDMPAIDPAWLEKAAGEVLAPFEWESGELPRRLRNKTSAVITQSAGIVRDENGLRAGLMGLSELENERIYLPEKSRAANRGWLDWLEARSMNLCGKAIMKSSLERRESRGVFIRSDHMYTDNDNGLYETIFKDGIVTKRFVEQGNVLPEAGRFDYFDSIERCIRRLSYSD
ncbi:MAG: FAD-binding protein [Clostridia bacterium]|nr:FAD-binding protein [Clostridia bacterium]